MSKKRTDFDIWDVLNQSVIEEPPPKTPVVANQTAKPTNLQTKTTLEDKILDFLIDLIALIIWIYILLKLFVFDIDIFIINSIFPNVHWVLDYKIFILIAVISLIAIFLWRLKTLLFLTYVLFFPIIVIFWKIPKLLFKLNLYKSWVFWMIFFNSLINFVKNFRYSIWSTGLTIVSIFIIWVSKNKYFIVPSSICLIILLLIALWKMIKSIFLPDRFLKTFTKAITSLSTTFAEFTDPVEEAKKLAKPISKTEGDAVKEIIVLKGQDLQNITGKIQMGIIGTRILYFVAYKLQQYKQLQLNVIFNLLTFGKIIFISLITFTSINIAILKLDPTQFRFDTYPSIIAMTLYSLCSFVLSDGGGISPISDLSYLVKIISGLYGVFFVGIIVVNFFVSAYKSKQDLQLNSIVEELRYRAKSQEAAFEQSMKVTFDEAFKRLTVLNLGGMFALYKILSKSIPIEFLNKDIE